LKEIQLLKKNNTITDVETVTHLENYIGYLSVADFIICINKAWVAKSASAGSYQYGFGLKLTQIRIHERPSKGGQREDTKTCQFSGSDDDSDDEIDQSKNSKETVKESSKDDKKDSSKENVKETPKDDEASKKSDKKSKKNESDSEEEEKNKKIR